MALTQVPNAMLSSDLQGVTPGFKNRIINGAFNVWQRGGSGTSFAATAYGPDRWRNYGGNALTLSTSTSYGSPQSLLIQATGTNHGVGQRIEAANIADLAGQTVTVSYKVRADNAGTHNFLMYYANAADNFSSETAFVNTAKSYTSNTVTTITHTVTLPSQAANGISVVFQWYNGGTSIGLTAFIWDVQLEVGSTATTFDRRSIGQELALCQRYYEQFGNAWWCMGETTNYNVVFGGSFLVNKRTTPSCSLLYTDIALYQFGVSNRNGSGCSIISQSQMYTWGGQIKVSGWSVITTGGMYGGGGSVASGYQLQPIAASAEL